jgi:hypothetical protein
MQKFVKVPIFPIAKYLSAEERRQTPAPMKPVSFKFGHDQIYIDTVLCCDRGVSRKVGGRGFRFECRVRWCNDHRECTKDSILWYDDFLQEWFVEVIVSKIPAGWETPTTLSDIGDFYDA